MSDPDKAKPKLPAGPGAEMPVERRMLLALALVGLVLILSQYLYSPSAPQNSGPKQQKPATAEQVVKPPAPTPAQQAPAPAAQGAAVKAQTEQFSTVETQVYKVVFSNHGAVVRSWILKNYRDTSGQPLDLVNKAAAGKTHFPFSLVYEDKQPAADANQALFVPTVSGDGLQVSFEYSDGRTRALKSFRFERDSYLFNVTSELTSDNAGVPHLLAWRGGFGDYRAHAPAASMKTLYFNTSDNKLVQNEVKKAKDGPLSEGGTYSFAGIEDTYFAAVFLPAERRPVRIRTMSDTASLVQGGGEEALIGVAVGGEARNQFSVFVGAKDLDLLKKVNPKLVGLVDFGWFSFLAHPLFIFLKWMNGYVHNYGWSIVLVTVVINMALWPLKFSGMKSMKKMASLQPQIQAINKKYENIPMRDPRKAEQNAEIMDLYKKHGVNPLGGGCMPLLLQIPFFFAFYKVLSIAIEMRGAPWLWIRDLSQLDPLYILPIVMVVSQFVMQKMTPQTTTDPAQQRMMLIMPLVFGFIFFSSPAGLVLYWVTGNLVSMVQQWFMNKATVAAPVAATAVVTPKPANKRGPGK